jgi:hypothetical protein
MQATLGDNTQARGGQFIGVTRRTVAQVPVITGKEIKKASKGPVRDLELGRSGIGCGSGEETGTEKGYVAELLQPGTPALRRRPGQPFVEKGQQKRSKESAVTPSSLCSVEAMTQIVGVAVEDPLRLKKREEHQTQDQQRPGSLQLGGRRPFDGRREGGLFGLQSLMKGAARARGSAANHCLASL